jgi:hypothetical protein
MPISLNVWLTRDLLTVPASTAANRFQRRKQRRRNVFAQLLFIVRTNASEMHNGNGERFAFDFRSKARDEMAMPQQKTLRFQEASQSSLPPYSVAFVFSSKVLPRMQSSALARVGRSLNEEPAIRFEPDNSVLNVSGPIEVGVFAGNPGDGLKEGRAHLCNEFLIARKLISKASAKGRVEAVFLAGAVDRRSNRALEEWGTSIMQGNEP